MRSRTPWALAALLFFTLAAGASEGSCNAPRRLVVLFTTDEHGHLLAGAPELDDFPLAEAPGTGALRGGVARRATIFEAERREARRTGAGVITISSGDFSTGTIASAAFLTTAPELVLLSKLGYDAVMLGNHEFDLGPTGLAVSIVRAMAQGAAPPLVLTNVTFDGEAAPGSLPTLSSLYDERGTGQPITRSRVIVTENGLKLGVLGVMGPIAASVAPGAAPLSFTRDVDPLEDFAGALGEIAAQVQPEITALRQVEEVDAVIVALHGGFPKDAADGRPPEVPLLVGALRGVDLYLGGDSHATPGRMAWATDADGREVAVLQAAGFGDEVGRAELLFPKNRSRPVLATQEKAALRFIPVDDRVLPTDDPEIRGALAAMMETLEGGVEADGTVIVPSFLEPTLSLILGEPIQHATPGDLYFFPLGHTGFDLVGIRPGENPLLDLDTDAMLATVRALHPDTALAVQNNGGTRNDLRKGRTGVISFADVYNVVPNGVDPTDLTPGYPLVRFHLLAVELRAAFEATLAGARINTDYFLSPSGLKVVYDPSRAKFDPSAPLGPGWIVRMALVNAAGEETQALYDASAAGGWLVSPLALYPVATSWWVAAFAEAFGIQPRDGSGAPLALADAIVRWPAPIGTAVKDHQALAMYVRGLCAANGGTLPSRYDETSPDAQPLRVICTGAACP